MNTSFPDGEHPLIRSAILPSGVITAIIEKAELKSEDLFDFAARDNPKRAFLFLSKVLGKHLPVSPSVMQDIHQRMARLIPLLPEPVIFIGMAETATGLGQGVFEAWMVNRPEAVGVFVHTSRYRMAGVDTVCFDEPHSHAPSVYLHVPSSGLARERFLSARSLVLIDDEISTGNTLVNLANACVQLVPSVERVHLGCITDFMGFERRGELSSRFGVPTDIGALLSGSYCFDFNGDGTATQPIAQRLGNNEVRLKDNGLGRLGRVDQIAVPIEVTMRLHASRTSDAPTLVLGTGEFMHPAFVLGRELQKMGGQVLIQSTTRSPIREWGNITSTRYFPDNYGEGVNNYIYGLDPSRYGKIVICCETDCGAHLRELAHELGAHLIRFASEAIFEEDLVC